MTSARSFRLDRISSWLATTSFAANAFRSVTSFLRRSREVLADLRLAMIRFMRRSSGVSVVRRFFAAFVAVVVVVVMAVEFLFLLLLLLLPLLLLFSWVPKEGTAVVVATGLYEPGSSSSMGSRLCGTVGRSSSNPAVLSESCRYARIASMGAGLMDAPSVSVLDVAAVRSCSTAMDANSFSIVP